VVHLVTVSVMHWCREYGHVWHFLRTFDLPYCSLYDEGYTSLGKRSLTLPNPYLVRKHMPEVAQAQAQAAVGAGAGAGAGVAHGAFAAPGSAQRVVSSSTGSSTKQGARITTSCVSCAAPVGDSIISSSSNSGSGAAEGSSVQYWPAYMVGYFCNACICVVARVSDAS
jgi:hypothetical protein